MKSESVKICRMLLRVGTLPQINSLLRAIHRTEQRIPDEVIFDIIATLQRHKDKGPGRLSRAVADLIGKTRSRELYGAARALGYLSRQRLTRTMTGAKGDLRLCINKLVYSPEVAQPSSDELHLWLKDGRREKPDLVIGHDAWFGGTEMFLLSTPYAANERNIL